jgi:ribosomal protein S18 acetylase RimI-like enzyme
MDQKINLRPAALADADILANLWVISFPDKFGPVLGTNALSVLRDWLRLSRRHLQTTTVAEVQGVIVGFIVLETPTSPRPDDGSWLWRALQLHNGIFGALRGLLLMVLIDANYQPSNDEVYIEMLGVDPTWRGQGIARRLINYAKDVACAETVGQLTLTVVSDNVPAIQLYRKMGFKARPERQRRLLKWITGHPGYYEMVTQVMK